MSMNVRQRNWMLMGVVFLMIILFNSIGSTHREPTRYFDVPMPMVIAHQGGDGLRPGNTMLAFVHADQLGVDALEMDVHATRDAVLVLMHDEAVDRTTDGSGLLREMLYDRVQSLDAAYHWPIGREPLYRGKGVKVPSLAKVFERFPGQRFNIEIKQSEPSITEPLCTMIRQYNLAGQTLVASFHGATLNEFRRTCPEVATSGTQSEITAFLLFNLVGLSNLHHPRALALQVPVERYGIQLTSSDRVAAARAMNLHVDAWTLNDETSIAQAFERGVTGIITDHPDIALKVRKSVIQTLSIRSDDR
jgi:glycerophosphoryl diester phosphodiesterase